DLFERLEPDELHLEVVVGQPALLQLGIPPDVEGLLLSPGRLQRRPERASGVLALPAAQYPVEVVVAVEVERVGLVGRGHACPSSSVVGGDAQAGGAQDARTTSWLS